MKSQREGQGACDGSGPLVRVVGAKCPGGPGMYVWTACDECQRAEKSRRFPIEMPASCVRKEWFCQLCGTQVLLELEPVTAEASHA